MQLLRIESIDFPSYFTPKAHAKSYFQNNAKLYNMLYTLFFQHARVVFLPQVTKAN